MQRNFSPALKGLITAILMIAIFLVLFYTSNQDSSSAIQYIPYAIYGAGIIWTLKAYQQSPAFTGRFRDLFSQGFRCFIVVTLMMVTFTGIFIKMHPEFAVEHAKAYKEALIKNKQTLPADIEEMAISAKNQYLMIQVSAAIFGYLMIGAVVTAVTSLFLTRRQS